MTMHIATYFILILFFSIIINLSIALFYFIKGNKSKSPDQPERYEKAVKNGWQQEAEAQDIDSHTCLTPLSYETGKSSQKRIKKHNYSEKFAKKLSWRIGLSCILFLGVIEATQLGLLKPHPLFQNMATTELLSSLASTKV